LKIQGIWPNCFVDSLLQPLALQRTYCTAPLTQTFNFDV